MFVLCLQVVSNIDTAGIYFGIKKIKKKKNLFSYPRQIDIDMVCFSFQLLKNISFENRTDNFKEVSKSKKYMNFLQFISKRWLGYIIWIENFVNLSYLQL